ncbi:MAG: 30S ribosomal protein S20, small subunit ribosomal protein S20 [Candidatus Peregrinibacteria bacterium GW2011_GWE2_39_6]|nr:MAG: 30S ribosomal protein S20, small subunit ribosomal protein S20 [Candidatus Peregrinibacteria bacterium GW2011_GWF2_39_17]KKR26709.1 MAG: 30S ribosomal protein S20, small subunit ribosomal protein S20 [Candidatus Peregrinibacteria bacterium GW2011_GWE2_39_6]HCW32926.1 30S ribosomal protein S20 [Candidatus Peregrinibacteria bacterium]
MPITQSAKKQLRQSTTKKLRNYQMRTTLKNSLKNLRAAAKSELGEAHKTLKSTYKIIDTAAKKNIIHSNKAAHLKSQMAKLVSKIVPSGAKTEENQPKKKSTKKK